MNAPAPSLTEWLAMPKAALAEQVAAHKLALYLSTDGTQRHYLLAHPETGGRILDYVDYARETAHAYSQVFELLFSLGVHTILTASMYPPNFQRGPQLLSQMIEMSRLFLVREPFTDLYARWQVQVRLYGDYDLAEAAVSARQSLLELDAELAVLSTGRERLLLFGYCAGSYMDELIARTMQLQQMLGRAPTHAELILACFPHGPHTVHLSITTGWLRLGVAIPPVLARGTDSYSLSHLCFDLTEAEARHILYDYLFLRHIAPEDNMPYTPEDLEAIRAYQAQYGRYVIGLGQLVGAGLWYPEHKPIDG